MAAPTFRERYSQHWSISPSDFEEHLFSRALYLHARAARPILTRQFFAPDREFLRNVGDIRSRRYFHAEAGEFHDMPENGRLLRRWLRLRVSAERTRRLMEECWGASDSVAPVPEVSAG